MASGSLRRITRQPVYRKQLWKIVLHTIRDMNVRSGVIRNAALIERGLERHLRARMRPKLSADDLNALFGPNGSFGTMASKIRAAYCFGIIGPTARRDLATINDIRNVFAHTPQNVTFRNKKLQEKVTSIALFTMVLDQMEEHPEEFRQYKDGYEMTSTGAFVLTVGIYGTILSHDRPKSLFAPSKWSYFGLETTLLLS